MANKGKVSEFTDIKSLPKWQKITIVTLILILAASFMISGVMLVVVEEATKPTRNMGKIGHSAVNGADYRTRYAILDRFKGEPSLWAEVPFLSPSTGELFPDFFTRFQVQDAAPTLPFAVMARYGHDNPTATESERAEAINGRLTWMHMLLYRLASDKGVHVSPAHAAMVARELVVKKPDPLADPEAALEEKPQDRETQYAEEVRKLGTTITEFETVIREMLIVKKFVESEVAEHAQVTADDLLDAYRAANQLVRADYLRVPAFNPAATAGVEFAASALPAGIPAALAERIGFDAEGKRLTLRGLMSTAERDSLLVVSSDENWQRAVRELFAVRRPWHPEIQRRAQEKLAEQRRQQHVRRAVAARTGLSADILFPDPVEQFALERLKSESGRANSNNYHETRYQLAIIAANYADLEPYVVIDSTKVQSYYDHYKAHLFRSDLTDEEITEIIARRKAELKKQHADDVPQTQPEEGTATPVEWAPEGGWDSWERREKEALRYKPLADVRDEIRHHLRRIGAKPLAHDLFRLVRESIDTRVRRNLDVRGHAETVARAGLDQARGLNEFYWGNPDSTAIPGLLNAIGEWESNVEAALNIFFQSAGLSHDPTAEGDNLLVAPTADIEWRHVAAAMDALARKIDEHWTKLMRDAKLGPTPLQESANELAAIEKRLTQIRRELARHRLTATDNASSRAIEHLQATEAGLERRKAEFEAVRAAFSEIRGALTTAVADARLGLHQPGKAPRIVVEAHAEAITSAVLETAQAVRVVALVESRAEAARMNFLAAQENFDEFRAQSAAVANNLVAELPPSRAVGATLQMVRAELEQMRATERQAKFERDRLQAQLRETQERLARAPESDRERLREQVTQINRRLAEVNSIVSALPRRIQELERFPAAIDLPVVYVQDRGEFHGAFFDGMPGTALPPFSVVGGLTINELETNEWLRGQLPYFASAVEWKLKEDLPAGDNLQAVLRKLTEGAYSQPLGVKDVGVYMVVLLAKHEPPVPAVAEVVWQAEHDYLVETLHRQVAEEFAHEIQKKLAQRAAEVVALPAETVAAQLSANSAAIVEAGLLGPNLRREAEYNAEALVELVGLLTKKTATIGHLPQAAAVAASARHAQALGEARSLLIGVAMAQIAREYDLEFGRTDWVTMQEDIRGVQIEGGDAVLVQTCLRLVPHFEIARVLTEVYAADPLDPEGRTTRGRTAFLVARSLGAKPNDRKESAIALTDFDYSTVSALRDHIRNMRIAGNDALQRYTDLGALMEHFKTARNTPIEIYSFKPEYAMSR